MQLDRNNVVVGMKVVINDRIGNYDRYFTKNKVYEVLVIDQEKLRVKIRSDNGDELFIYVWRFDIFEENKVKYWVCIKGSSSVDEGSYFLIENTLRNDNRLLINGYWQSVTRFKQVEQPPLKKEPPPPKSLAQLLSEKQKKDGPIGTCSYAIMNEKGDVKYQVNDVCHARIRPYNFNGPLSGVSLMVQAHADKIGKKDNGSVVFYLRAVDYILNRSPWSSIFIKKDFNTNFGCVNLDVNRGINAVACAAIALRTCSEFYQCNETFCALVDAGVDEHVAYIVAHQCSSKSVGELGGGHHIFSSACTKASVFNFFKTGNFIDEGEEYKASKLGYKVISSQFNEEFREDHKEDTLRNTLIDIVRKCKTISKKDRWGGVFYTWEVPNNLIPLAQQLEKEFFNV